jgi:hypothetical protein
MVSLSSSMGDADQAKVDKKLMKQCVFDELSYL